MASPQKENGYTAIANEILEQIAKVKLSATQYKVILIIWRYTYGFNRKEHDLSLGFLAQATMSDKRQLQRELKELENRCIIKQKIKNGKSRLISFNKDYEQWSHIKSIGKSTIGKSTNGKTTKATLGETTKGSIGEITNQERNIKDNIKDKGLSAALEDFKKMRKSIKKPMTDRAVTMLVNKLNKLADTDEMKIEILEQSIMNCWADIYEIKEKKEQTKTWGWDR